MKRPANFVKIIEDWFDANPQPPSTIWVETKRFKKFIFKPLGKKISFSVDVRDDIPGGSFSQETRSVVSMVSCLTLPWETSEEEALNLWKEHIPGFPEFMYVLLSVEDEIIGERRTNPEFTAWVAKRKEAIPDEWLTVYRSFFE